MMHRRRFLQRTAAGTLGLIAAHEGRLAFAQTNLPGDKPPSNDSAKLRGVNLGGWLVLEKWMVPSVYRDTSAGDEYELCRALGDQAKARLDRHRKTFITAEDFRWIKNCGLNAVRLPVGYWALEAPPPFVAAAGFVDFAFEQAQRNGLQLVLDLHGAPGSQNGWDHSGRSGPLGWHTSPENIQETLRILESFAQRYGKHPALAGIELLNEPGKDVPIEILKTFYRDAYPRIRNHTDPRVAIVVHDGFRAFDWRNFMTSSGYSNVLLDTHLYQCFSDQDRLRTAQEHIQFALDRKKTLERMELEELPTIVGEWSLGTPDEVWRGLSPLQKAVLKRAYGDAQLLSYENTHGWFYWSYKLEHDSDWNFRHCVERDWLPRNFALSTEKA